MTRSEHVAWCKERAAEYLAAGDLANAVASMASDMSKHPDCGINPFIAQLGMMEVMNHNRDGVKRWVEGFN